MDWLERWFGMYPDGGNGMVEAEIVVAVILAIAAGVVVWSPKARAVVETAIKKATVALRVRRQS
jgi:hypothetical protein